jgi:UMF1 family MFS transporter
LGGLVARNRASIFGPLLFSVTIALTGSSRNAILSVITFFAVGAVVLAFVDVEKGQKAARDAEAGLRLTSTV